MHISFFPLYGQVVAAPPGGLNHHARPIKGSITDDLEPSSSQGVAATFSACEKTDSQLKDTTGRA